MSARYVRLLKEAQQALEDDPARAQECVREALSIRRAYAPLWQLYADAAARAGDAATAYEAYRRAAFLQPDAVQVLTAAGRLAKQLGKGDEAADWTRRAVAATKRRMGTGITKKLALPRRLSGLFGRGRAGRGADAGHPLVQQAAEANAARQFARAHELLTRALADRPDDPDILRRRAGVNRALSRPHDAVEDLRKARAAAPDDVATALALVGALADNAEVGEARAILETLPADQRQSPAARLAEAEIKVASGQAAEAAALLEQVGSAGKSPVLLNHLAHALVTSGQFEKAARRIEEAACLEPKRGKTYRLAATIEAMPPGSTLFTMAEKLAADGQASQEDRAAASFALGHALRAAGDAEGSFARFADGNALTDVSYDAEEWDAFAKAVIGSAASVDYGRWSDSRRGERRIFVVGMPRSGSSLVEQILSAHPQIVGIGEDQTIRRIVGAFREKYGYPEGLPRAEEAELQRLADEYFAMTEAGITADEHVVDKALTNFLHLGLMAMLFPAAKVVHCVRDPVDVGYSIFCQDFVGGAHKYAYALEHIGHFHRVHDYFMENWKKILPLRIHEVRYEDLVDNPVHETERLLEAVGVAFDERCLAFHEAAGDVRTASAFQVRQKLNKRSVGAWRKQADNLRALRDALERGGPERA